MDYVLHHGPICRDGFGAAFAAWLTLGDDATYLPVNYGQPLPDLPGAGAVYVVDFCYPADDLLRLAGRCEKLVVLDHHKSARGHFADLAAYFGQEDIPARFSTVFTEDTICDGDILACIQTADRFDLACDALGLKICFSQRESGAVMAWHHFNRYDNHAPLFFRYLQDRDLWAWKLPHSKAINAAIRSYPMDFAVWKNLAHTVNSYALLSPPDALPRALSDLLMRGEAILRHIDEEVSLALPFARLATIAGHVVPVLNAPMYQSEIGEALCHAYPAAPFAMTYTVAPDGKVIYSLRSRGDFDVSDVAKRFGGGGHAAAAGFQIDPAPAFIVLLARLDAGNKADLEQALCEISRGGIGHLSAGVEMVSAPPVLPPFNRSALVTGPV